MKYITLSKKADEKIDSGDIEEARNLLNEGLLLAKQKRDISYIEFFLGKLENLKKEYNDGLLHINKAIRYDSKNLLFLVNLGDTYKLLENCDEAIKAFDRALEINPKDYDSLYCKAVLLSELGKEDEAIKLFDRALSEKPDDYNSLRSKGISFSKLEKEDKAIELFARALSENPDDYNSLRSKGVSLSKLGKEEEAIELFERALSENPGDYNSLRSKGISLSKSENEKEAIEFFERALEIKPDDYNSLYRKGISFSKLGNYDEAIKAFDQALSENPDDYNSLRSKGVLFSKLGKEDKAIELFDRALSIKSDDYNSLCNKGISFSQLGNERVAIKLFEEALSIKPDDYNSLYHKGVLFNKLRIEDKAIKLFDRALLIKPDDLNSLIEKALALEKLEKIDSAIKIIEHLQNNIELEDKKEYVHYKYNYLKTKIEPTKIEVIKKSSDILNKVINEFHYLKDDFLKSMGEIESDFKKYIDTISSIPPGSPSFLSILRKWNSYTPIIPSENGDNKGGGYFLYHRGKGFVIDPGFNFIENFYQEGFKIADIDAVVITHAHNDHTVDLESIITLVYKYNDAIKKSVKEKMKGTNVNIDHEIKTKMNKDGKRIDLLLNVGTFMKYSGWLNIKDSCEINNITVLQPNTSYNLSNDYDGIIIHTVKAKHNEIISNKYAIGLIFEIKDPDVKLGFTGDTGWDYENNENIASVFKNHGPTLVVAHLGSIKSSEFNYSNAKNDDERNKCFYEQHLGLLGMVKFLDEIKPKLTIISEFGEELKRCRMEIVQEIGNVLNLKCLPGDIGLHIRLNDLYVHCFDDNEFIDHDHILLDSEGADILYSRYERGSYIFDEALSSRKKKKRAIQLSDRTSNW